ncbi:response regulator [Ignavibacteriales bacterium]
MRKQKILIVDDIDANLISLERVLLDLDVTIIRAKSGNEALIAILNHDFAMAIVDVQMPEMDGYELVELIRSEGRTKELPVIFVSAVYSDEYHVFKGYESGAVDFITKPYNPYYLLSKVKVFLDIDRQKFTLLETIELEKSRNYLESILRSINDSLIVLDLDGKITKLNQSACSILGFSENELIGMSVNNFFDNDFLTTWTANLGNSENNTLPKTETRMIQRSGESFPVLASGSLFRNTTGEIMGSVMVLIDISDRVTHEKAVLAAKERAEESSRLTSNFLSNMSHELRTPLMGIVGYADLLRDERLTEEQKELVENIYNSSRRLSHTLNSILDFSKLESNAQLIDLKPANLEGILQKVIEFYKDLAAEKGLEFSFVSNCQNPFAMINEKLFEEIVNHLFDNAIKFTVKGSIKLEILNLRGDGEDFVTINLTDTGIGIMERDLDIIWDEFRQASEGMNRKFQGAGLGLTLAKKFTSLMNGRIFAKSSFGKGSVFTVQFPVSNIAPALENRGDTTNPVYEPSPQKELPHILYVEDEVMNQQLISMFLRNVGNTDVASTGEEAMEMAKNTIYDCFLMDINLGPGINGIEVIRRLRSMNEYANTPIIAVTALALDGDRESLLNQGCSHYLAKPFKKSDLVKMINSIFSQ